MAQRLEEIQADHEAHIKTLKAVAKAQGRKTESQKQRELLKLQGEVTP
jgi:hypothetical protein